MTLGLPPAPPAPTGNGPPGIHSSITMAGDSSLYLNPCGPRRDGSPGWPADASFLRIAHALGQAACAILATGPQRARFI